MPCERIRLDNGSVAIVCTTRRGKQATKLCETCMCTATLLCDWKVGKKANGHVKTCDTGICSKHATEVAPDKHLCPTHASAWRNHPRNTEAT